MLQKFRDHTQGWIAWVLITIICFTFALWGIGNYLHTHDDKDIVATVNKHTISQRTLDKAYEQLRQQQTAKVGHAVAQTAETEKVMRQQALDQLIINSVLIDDALHRGLRVAPISVKNAIEHMPYFQQAGQFNKARFEQVLMALRMNVKQLSDDIRQQLLMGQVYRAFTDTSFALPAEVERELVLLRQQRVGTYAIVPSASIKEVAPLADETLQQYYEAHKADYDVPEKIQLAYVELSAQSFSKHIIITDEQVAAYYEENKDNYRLEGQLIPLSQVKNSIRGELKNQKIEQAFADGSDSLGNLAYENPNSLKKVADKMGLTLKTTTTFTRDDIPSAGILHWPQVRRIIFSDELLSGNNSDVIVLEPGESVAVVRVIHHEPAHAKPFNAVKTHIVAALNKHHKTQQALQKAQGLAQAINVHEQSPRILLKKANLVEHPIKVTRQDKKVPATLLQTLFTLSLPSDEHARKPIAQGVILPNGDAAVVILQHVIDVPPQALSASAVNTATSALRKVYGNVDYELYKIGVLNKAEIK